NALSYAEFNPGAFYALDAKTMGVLYSDTSSFLMAKFTTPTVYNGRVFLATMSNEVRVYGPDQDGDLVIDSIDNCPTVDNADQANANYDAELILGKPILGDACDPNAATSMYAGGAVTDSVQVGCNQILVGCGQASNTPATCSRAFNASLTVDAHIGNDAGTAPNANGTSGPAFCKCTSATQH